MAARALGRLEALLTGIYDLDIGCRVGDFLVTDRQQLPDGCRESPGEEQLFVAVDGWKILARSLALSYAG